MGARNTNVPFKYSSVTLEHLSSKKLISTKEARKFIKQYSDLISDDDLLILVLCMSDMANEVLQSYHSSLKEEL